MAAHIGFFTSVLLTMAISMFGLFLMKGSGLPMTRVRPDQLAGLLRGQGFRMLAGLLLFIPGFLTDILGLAFLMRAAGSLFSRKAPDVTEAQGFRHEDVTGPANNAGTRSGGRTVDGEFERLD